MMKRKATWQKMFANHICPTKISNLECIKMSQNSSVKQTKNPPKTNKKWKTVRGHEQYINILINR